MSFTTPGSVPSGVALPVSEVAGRSPASLEDFHGDVSFWVGLEPPHLVAGCGRLDGSVVRFHEKDVQNSGKDIRVWEVRLDGDRFVAQQASQY
jgi:hypothetical protein